MWRCPPRSRGGSGSRCEFPPTRGKVSTAAASRWRCRVAARRELPLEFTVHEGTLDAVDIPAGPWGHTIDLPWDGPEAEAWNRDMAAKSLRKLREYGFTTASGLPVITYRGFQAGRPDFDFTIGDQQMKTFREAGFSMPVVTYCPLSGLNTYGRDAAAMQAAGMSDYSQFVRALFSAVQKHAVKRIGCRSTGTSATSRLATISRAAPKTPRPIARPFPPVLRSSPRPVRSLDPTSPTRISVCPAHCTSPTGTCTTKRR